MNHSFVSLILVCSELPSRNVIEELSKIFESNTKRFEIILTLPIQQRKHIRKFPELQIPISIIWMGEKSSIQDSTIAGLSLSVGDFALEWKGDSKLITAELISKVRTYIEAEVDIIQFKNSELKFKEKLLLNLFNKLRHKNHQVHFSLGNFFSRRAINEITRKFTSAGDLNLIIANSQLNREIISVNSSRNNYLKPISRNSNFNQLFLNGTKLGTRIPSFISIISALVGVFSTVYALSIFIYRGRTPEGWVTLMVLIGYANASILTLLGLMWKKLEAIENINNSDYESSILIEVIPPFRTSS